MTALAVETEPGAVGLNAARLARVDGYLNRLVDDGRLPGWQFVITRHGRVAHAALGGYRDIEARLPIQTDTLYRIYSMTKPITAVAAMMLYEHGAFELNDPVSRFLPEFAEPRVYAGGSDTSMVTVPAAEPIRVRHLLTHTAGMTYGFFRQHPVDALYRAAGLDRADGFDPTRNLAGLCERIAQQPLLFQPGTEWAYSVATDVLGRLIEVLSGESLDEFFAKRIFAPLGMTDTAFGNATVDTARLARLYGALPSGLTPMDDLGRTVEEPTFLSGGGGLISSAHDYHRFTQLLLSGGVLDGVRLLGPRTVAYMTSNQLPGNVDLARFGRPLYAETPYHGTGFGLGFAVKIDPIAAGTLGSAGTYSWGGAASTTFWVDPAEQLTAQFFTQLAPSDALPLRTVLYQLVYQALVD